MRKEKRRMQMIKSDYIYIFIYTQSWLKFNAKSFWSIKSWQCSMYENAEQYHNIVSV